MVTYLLEMHKQDHQGSSMPNQQMVTYTLEMHKQGKIIRDPCPINK